MKLNKEEYYNSKFLKLPPLIEDETFDINDFKVQVHKNKCGDYLVIDNFWKYPDKIHELALMTPTTKIKGAYYTSANGRDYYDGRNHFNLYKKLDFIWVLEDIMNKIFNITIVDVSQDWRLSLVNNLFNITPGEYAKRKDCYYGPHSDGKYTIAAISYFNKEYSSEDGTAMFVKNGQYKECGPWLEKSEAEKIGFLPAAYNRMILYDGSVYHASCISSRWINEIRHSMVYFMRAYR